MDQTPRPRIQSIKIPSPKKSPSIDNRRDHNPHRLPGWSTRLKKWSIKWEVPRKLLHTSIGFITLHEYMHGKTHPTKTILTLTKALSVIIAADILRSKSARFSRFYNKVLGVLMRERERSGHWNGVIFYIVGVLTSLSTLPLDISVLSILILSWVDTAASITGRRYGKALLPSPPFAPRKSVAGFLGALVVGSSTAYGFWSVFANRGVLVTGHHHSWMSSSQLLTVHHRETLTGYVPTILNDYLISKIQLSTPNSSMGILPLSLACGLISALAESWNLFGWDDNLVLPILSGWGIWGIMKIF
ncbi:hypothetical protein PSTG_01445 [Puccinia striiformis f. sp. tritici PST-78]|uniref:Phosphatidate cytidylyltransferase n=1 Tax=Puccinia striiformis f. sp. tritici PST-78 TaxID=1165861 RepID=A0A0L0W131_9BASI|nr:hypothetical protein PSTG_01445 [Puccinia striiformis f. sp. tritici PST-78]